MFHVFRLFNARRRRWHFIQYYPIDERLAQIARRMSSLDSYIEGSATAEYRQAVDKAAQIAEEQKRKAPPDHHLEIDGLLDTYARRLAANINHGNAIAARLPSVLFDQKGLHFPAQKVERQKRDAAANQEDREHLGQSPMFYLRN